jgi:glycosyltransferase involved in cell wall biosynthesis
MPPKPRILVLIPSYLPIVGGAEVAVAELADRLPQFEFVLICGRLRRELPRYERMGPVEVHRVGIGVSVDAWFLPVLGALKALTLARRERFALVQSVGANQAAATAFVLSHIRRRTPSLLSLVGTSEDLHAAGRWLGPLYRAIHRRADAIHALTTWHMDQARAMGYARPITVVPYGADVDRFRPEGEGRARVRKRLGIADDAIVLVTTARLVARKRIDDLIRSLRHLPRDTHVAVAGTGPEGPRLAALARSEAVSDRVHLLGHVPDADLPDVLRAADAFVLPSSSEGFGIASVEAMATGVPVIVTPVDGVPDLVSDGRTGLWCEAGNPASIASCVQRLQASPELRQNLIGAARALAVERYNWDRIAERFARLYTGLIQTGSA